MDTYYVATFHSVSQALRFEVLMQSLDHDIKLIPVPRVISSSCGIAARFPEELLRVVEGLAQTGQAELEGVFLFNVVGKKTDVKHCPGPWQE